MDEYKFIDAVKQEMDDRLKKIRLMMLTDLTRDTRGLPTVEQEHGWRAWFRGLAGGRD